jgi:superfamily I DNA and RNA helicase
MLATIEQTQRLNATTALQMDATIEQFKSRYILNGDQIEAITTTNGPMQIVAGSGAGKTLVLILRRLYLL